MALKNASVECTEIERVFNTKLQLSFLVDSMQLIQSFITPVPELIQYQMESR